MKSFLLYCIILLSFVLILSSCQEIFIQEDRPFPKEKSLYVFPYQTKVDALWLPCAATYHGKESSSDEVKRMLRKEVHNVTLNEQVKLGLNIHRDHLPYKISNNARERRKVQGIIEKMKPFLNNQQFKYQAFILESDAFNAFTIPGGNIYVTTGLLNTVNNEDELAYVIGHELGHNENGHTKEGAQFMAYVNSWREYVEKEENEWAALLKTAGAYAAIGSIKLISNYFNQPDEIECDLTGIYLAYKAGYDPENAVKGLLHLKRADQPKPSDKLERRIIDFFRTHPWSEDRYNCAVDYVAQAKTKIKCQRDGIYPKDKKGVVATKQSPLNLRVYPNLHSKRIGKMDKGATVELICDCVSQENRSYEEWMYIKNAEGQVGWGEKQIHQNSRLNIDGISLFWVLLHHPTSQIIKLHKILTRMNLKHVLFKYLFIMAVFFYSNSTLANIIRVNNTPGSNAPFSDLTTAHAIALHGDTIHIEGSNLPYGDLTIDKQLVIIGPGYFLQENQNTPVSQTAVVRDFKLARTNPDDPFSGASGTQIWGLSFTQFASSDILVEVSNAIIKKCEISRTVAVRLEDISGVHVIQNFFYGNGVSFFSLDSGFNNLNFSNNIVGGNFSFPENSTGTIMHNLFLGNSWKVVNFSGEIRSNILTTTSNSIREFELSTTGANMVSHNTAANGQFGNDNENNVGPENLVFVIGDDNSTDGQYQLAETAVFVKNNAHDGTDRGPFGGIRPYCLSGIGDIPSIISLRVPPNWRLGEPFSIIVEAISGQ